VSAAEVLTPVEWEWPEQPELSFDPDRHEYRWKGQLIPSCTGILRSAGLVNFDGVHPKTLQDKADLGQVVHEATALWEVDNLDDSQLTEYERGYFQAYVNFFEQRKPIWLWRERPASAELHGMRYGFTADRVGWLDGELTVAEIKCTCKVEKSHGPQLAAQAAGIPLPKSVFYPNGIQRWEIHLAPDATYKPVPFTKPTDLSAFKWALALEYWKRS
jgi:hypothetical protein